MTLLDGAGAKLDGHTYPTTTGALIEAHGDHELELQNGSETLGEALGRLGDCEVQDAAEARQLAYSVVSEKAIGRKGYSDRDPVMPGEDGPRQLSF